MAVSPWGKQPEGTGIGGPGATAGAVVLFVMPGSPGIGFAASP